MRNSVLRQDKTALNTNCFMSNVTDNKIGCGAGGLEMAMFLL